MSDIQSKARPWLIWPWRAVLAVIFVVGLCIGIADLANSNPGSDLAGFLSTISRLVALGFCALLVARGHRSRAALLLAVIMLAAGSGIGVYVPNFPGSYVPNLPGSVVEVSPTVGSAAGLLFIVVQMSLAVAFPVFGLEVSGGPYSRRQARLVYGFSAILAAVVGGSLIAATFLQVPFVIRTFPTFITWFALVDQFFTYAVIAVNYRHNDAAGRNRLKIVLVAFVLGLMVALAPLFVINPGVTPDPVQLLTIALLRFVYLALVAYAVLKQRLVDLGFAVNRTLVYGAAAFTLLATFGLVEYVAKSMIPVAWPTAGPFISAGIAVLLFLSFHRLHHWFEHHIERVFFRKWQEAEAELRRFVQSASHFDKMPALCSEAAKAVSRFADGASAALYLRGSDGAYRLEAGKLSGAKKAYADDDPAFALMRAERKPLELARTHGGLPGELALPMIEQGTLAGFVLLALKADGTHYRPDETELLDWAVRHIGLDLRALHARQLEAQVVSLSEKLSWTEKQLARKPPAAAT